jgi:hypothetical protein
LFRFLFSPANYVEDILFYIFYFLHWLTFHFKFYCTFFRIFTLQNKIGFTLKLLILRKPLVSSQHLIIFVKCEYPTIKLVVTILVVFILFSF